MNEAAWHHNLNRGVLIAPAVTYDGRNGNGVWKGSQLRTRLRLDVTDISEVICEIGEEYYYYGTYKFVRTSTISPAQAQEVNPHVSATAIVMVTLHS